MRENVKIKILNIYYDIDVYIGNKMLQYGQCAR